MNEAELFFYKFDNKIKKSNACNIVKILGLSEVQWKNVPVFLPSLSSPFILWTEFFYIVVTLNE